MAGRLSALPEPFAIGLRPIGERHWLRPDARRTDYLAEKRRLDALDRDAVFAALEGTEEAQAEALALVVGWLDAFAPNLSHERRIEGPPLLAAGMMLCEDLVLMRREAKGWTLVAASLHFPSAWRLAEKIGRPMHEVHAPVPGYAEATRGATLVERIFDALAPGTIVERANWSLHDEATLHLPANPPDHVERLREADPSALTVRRERQTLRKLPGSGDILFTIDVEVPRADALAPEERAALSRQLRALDGEQRAYKGVPAAERIADGLATSPDASLLSSSSRASGRPSGAAARSRS